MPILVGKNVQNDKKKKCFYAVVGHLDILKWTLKGIQKPASGQYVLPNVLA
jgi:hypothetical protein